MHAARTLAEVREKLQALKAPAEVTEQRRQVTVLFADLSVFTAMARAAGGLLIIVVSIVEALK